MLTILILPLLCFLTSAQNNECSLNFSFNVSTIDCQNLHLNGPIISSKSVIPSGIVYLNIRNCTGHVDERALDNLGGIYSLSIDDSRLSTFNLPSLPNLSDLDVRNSIIPKLSKNTLKNARNLKHITFEKNKMEIENGSFQYLNTLSTLDIEQQNVTLNRKFLSGLKKISLLSLVETGISRIPVDAFKESTELLDIKLDKNPIEQIETGGLDPLNQLKQFSILETQLQKLDMDLFKKLRKLETLGVPARILKNIDLRKCLTYCPSLFNFDFVIEDCGKPEIDNLLNQAVILRTVIKVNFDGFSRQNNNC